MFLIIIAVIILFAGVALYVQSQKSENMREGTEKLSAEQVVDLEVQADRGAQNR